MATKNLIPQASGEGGIGIEDVTWGDAYFDSGHFNKGLYISGVAVSTGNVGGLGGKWDDGTTAGDIYYNGGNVGIGTMTPGRNLEVKGEATFIHNDSEVLISNTADHCRNWRCHMFRISGVCLFPSSRFSFNRFILHYCASCFSI